MTVGVKLFAFSRRRAGTTPEEFHAHWRDVHARQIADEPTLRRHVRRYELNHRLPQDYARDRHGLEVDDAGWDGVAVLWFASLDDFEALRQEPAYAAHAGDGSQFREPDQRIVFTRDPDVIVSKPERVDAGAKMLCILRRNAALDLPTFHQHWLHHHGGLFQRIPELNEPLLAYEQNHGIDLPDAGYDGVTEQWFASLGSFVTSLDAPAHRTDVEPDVAYLLDPASITFVMSGPPTVVIEE